jgi:hypothetical protein
MSPPVFCPSCERTYFNARPEDVTCLHCGTVLERQGAGNGHSPPPAVRHRLSADTRVLRAMQTRLARILADVDAHDSRRVRFVVTELLAQSIRVDNGFEPGVVELTVEVSERTVRVEAHGPGVSAQSTSDDAESNGSGSFSDLAFVILDELAADWGSAGGAHPRVWFEVERTPEPALAATRS